MDCTLYEEPVLYHAESFACQESHWTVGVSKQCYYGKVESVTPNALPLAEHSGHFTNLNIYNETEKQASKRPREEEFSRSGVSNRATRRRAKRETASLETAVGKKVKVENRVGCPFHKHDPQNHQQHACRGKGFEEMGKLK
jgi:hypothetical protein